MDADAPQPAVRYYFVDEAGDPTSVRLIHDVDDTRQNRYGEYYNQRNPLTAAVRKRE